MSNSERLQNVLAGASELPTQQRAPYLDAACRGDAAMRAEVESLLQHHDEAGRFMSDPTANVAAKSLRTPVSAADAATVADAVGERPGTRIGPYKLLQQIGEGGFGAVFMAEQEKPVQRKVALKIIKLGMDTRQVIARFEAERQALAMMDHPHIARVLDAGATETGRPFFVMELVKGDPIVQYCDRNNLSIEDRLELFAQVCHAVQHAHTKGIIHRDIKPSNVLVSTQDGRASAKVIDFGIAKATASKLTEKTLFTEHRQLIGTPEYMSPEQAEGSLDIDTRTDVYSLGVLLYELLTGSTPFDGKELRSAAYGEIQRMIREVDPPKPSTRLSQNSNTLANVAAHRKSDPRRLGITVRGELDWIVMKALEKDRAHRYETANLLAMDVRRCLAGDAVVAAPPSTMYRMRKFVRRNKGIVLSGSAVAAALLIGATAFAWQANVARTQRDAAVVARKDAEENARLAEAQATLALGAIQQLVTAANSELAGPSNQAFKKSVLDVALASIEHVSESYEKSTSKEATASAIHNTLGRVLMDLGQSDKALVHFQRSLEIATERVKIKEFSDPSRMNLAGAHSAMGWARESVGRDMTSVLAHQLECVKIVQDVYDHPKLDGNQRNRNEVATTLADVIHSAAVTYFRLGDIEASAAHFRRGLALREELARAEPDATSRRQSLCFSYLGMGDAAFRLGQNDQAMQYFERTIDLRKSLCALPSAGSAERSDLGGAYYMLGEFQLRTGDLQHAGDNLQRSLALRREVAMADPKIIAWQRFVSLSLYWLGSLAERQNDVASAKVYFTEARAIGEQLARNDPANDKREIELMLVLPHVGDVAAAAAIADRFASHPQLDNELRVDMARCYVQCARSLPTERGDDAKRFRAKAVQVLRDAIGNGYSDRVALATEPDLAPLTQDAEFVSAVAEIPRKN